MQSIDELNNVQFAMTLNIFGLCLLTFI